MMVLPDPLAAEMELGDVNTKKLFEPDIMVLPDPLAVGSLGTKIGPDFGLLM